MKAQQAEHQSVPAAPRDIIGTNNAMQACVNYLCCMAVLLRPQPCQSDDIQLIYLVVTCIAPHLLLGMHQAWMTTVPLSFPYGICQ